MTKEREEGGECREPRWGKQRRRSAVLPPPDHTRAAVFLRTCRARRAEPALPAAAHVAPLHWSLAPRPAPPRPREGEGSDPDRPHRAPAGHVLRLRCSPESSLPAPRLPLRRVIVPSSPGGTRGFLLWLCSRRFHNRQTSSAAVD
ncbi:hypothetical protein NL676_008752 [Syzygium grande]|nr:hypothetical protein NL676_008752 [Syzygium grande]